MFVLSPALRNIFHIPEARYSLFVVKVLLNTNKPNQTTSIHQQLLFWRSNLTLIACSQETGSSSDSDDAWKCIIFATVIIPNLSKQIIHEFRSLDCQDIAWLQIINIIEGCSSDTQEFVSQAVYGMTCVIHQTALLLLLLLYTCVCWHVLLSADSLCGAWSYLC